METMKRTEQRHYKIGDGKYHVNLKIEIDHLHSGLTYVVENLHGRDRFLFANSEPETMRKVLDLLKAALHKVVTVCKEEGLHIAGLTDEESTSSNGAQGDTPQSARDDL